VGGDTYLSGRHALQAYLDPAVLAAAGIRLAFQEWQAPIYAQLYPGAGFVPDLAILDLLFNEGPRAREILLASGAVAYPERECKTGPHPVAPSPKNWERGNEARFPFMVPSPEVGGGARGGGL
jgi:hypothetical protein